MKKVLIFIVLAFSLTLILSSCGGWRDNIKLSTKTAKFSANGDSILITTKGNSWWLSDITVDNKRFYNYDGIDVHADSYIVKQDCFIFQRRDKHTLFIKLEPNPLNLKRTVIFELEAGDYFDRVTITQNPQ
jgi:uncharacterized lipoprotein YehR (DUF1307 family)